ncbi:flagellar hook-length control protein FliK [Phenylobacterium aquaticum]|uniref:flagellar hook-length control protein FliK n=1 Tax=Phenylobacterium aquaticum TaxID=1763816 RepID=UPI0026F1BC61|nr:flagellar hook-length control protein FliK [Phenylobacterium aquaticum]
MAAGFSIAAQTAQTSGVAGAGANAAVGLFGKTAAAGHGQVNGFETLLAAFFGHQGMNPTGAAANALLAAAGKAAGADATQANGAAKTGDDKAADALAAVDAPASPDATATALLYMLSGQTPAAPQPATTAAKAGEGAVATDDALLAAGGKGAAHAAQTARLANAANDALDAHAAEIAGDDAAGVPDLGLPAQAAQTARAAGRAGQDAAAYAPAGQGANAAATPVAPVAAAQIKPEAAPPAEPPPIDAAQALEVATPPTPELQAVAAEAAPPALLTPAERPTSRAAKAAEARKEGGAAPTTATAAASAAQPATATTAIAATGAQAQGADTADAVDPALGKAEAETKTDAKDPTNQPAAAPALAAEQATGTSRATVPVRGSPETVASLAAQIVKKLDGRTTRFDVELNPADLGRVDVRIEIGAHGRLTASMSFENPQAAAELRGRADELTKALEQAGFDMSGGMSFDVAGDRGQANQNQTGQSTSDGGGQARGRAFQAALDTASGSADAALSSALAYRTRPAAGVDIRI